MFWLLRMKRWVQHPPSKSRVYLVLGVGLICFAIAMIEFYFGWPDSLSLSTDRRPTRIPAFN